MNTYSDSYWVALVIYNSGQKWYVRNEVPNKNSVNYVNEIIKNYQVRIK